MATASSSFARNKSKKHSKELIKGLKSNREEPKTVNCKDKIDEDKFETLKLHREDQSLEESADWRLGSQELADQFTELYPELSQTLAVDESEPDSEREESSEEEPALFSPSSCEDTQCVPGDTKGVITSSLTKKRHTKKRTKSKMEETVQMDDSQVSFSSGTQSQSSDRPKTKRKSRTPRKVKKKKVRQIKEESESDEELVDPEKEKLGSWAQCSVPLCSKWRYLKTKVDPTEIPDRWVCSMNPDPQFSTCDASQELFDSQDENYYVVYSPYPSGAIVWAKLAGYPWWPAMMQDDPDYGCYYESRPGSRTPVSYHVVFFDKDVSRAWVGCANVRMFHLDDKPDDMALGKGRKNKNTKQLQKAIDEARTAFEMALEKRLETYGFEKRYNGPVGYQEVAEAAESEKSEDKDDQEVYTLSSQEFVLTNDSCSSLEDTKKAEKQVKSTQTPRKTPSKSGTKHNVPVKSDIPRKETSKTPTKKQKPKMKTAKGEKAVKKKDKPTKPVFKCKNAKLASSSTDPETGDRECHVLSEMLGDIKNAPRDTDEANTRSGGEDLAENAESTEMETTDVDVLWNGIDIEQDDTQAVRSDASGDVKSRLPMEEAATDEIKTDTASNKNKKPRKRKSSYPSKSSEANVEKKSKDLIGGDASKKKTKKLCKEAASEEEHSSNTCENNAASSSTETISNPSVRGKGLDAKSRKTNQSKSKKKVETLTQEDLDEGAQKPVKAEQQNEDTRARKGQQCETERPRTSQEPCKQDESNKVEETSDRTFISQQSNGKKTGATGKKKDRSVGVTKGNASTKAKLPQKMPLNKLDSVTSGKNSNGKKLQQKLAMPKLVKPKLVKPTFTPPTNAAKAQKRMPKLVKARFICPTQRKPSEQNEDGTDGKENSPVEQSAHKKISLAGAGRKRGNEEKSAIKAAKAGVGPSAVKMWNGNPRESSASEKIPEEIRRNYSEEHPTPQEDANERSLLSVEAEIAELDKEMEDLKKDLQRPESMEIHQCDDDISLSHSSINDSPMQEHHCIMITDSPEF